MIRIELWMKNAGHPSATGQIHSAVNVGSSLEALLAAGYRIVLEVFTNDQPLDQPTLDRFATILDEVLIRK